MGEKEREKEWEWDKPKDWSAEERFVNRSLKIRRKIFRWLNDHRGAFYYTREDMAADAANFARCAIATAHRWITQYSRPDQPFHIQDTDTGYVIWARADMKPAGVA